MDGTIAEYDPCTEGGIINNVPVISSFPGDIGRTQRERLPLPIFVHADDADLHLHISTFLLVRPISVIVAVLGGHRRLVCHRCRILRRTSRCQNCLYNHSVNDDLLTQNKNSLTCAVRAQLFENYVDQVRGGPDMVFGEY